MFKIPDGFSPSDSLGFVWNKSWDTPELKWIGVQNAFNALGYFFLVFGIVRIGNAAYYLYKNESSTGVPLTKDQTNYLWSQIARGFFETIGPGFLLIIPDIIMTVHRRNSGCTV